MAKKVAAAPKRKPREVPVLADDEKKPKSKRTVEEQAADEEEDLFGINDDPPKKKVAKNAAASAPPDKKKKKAPKGKAAARVAAWYDDPGTNLDQFFAAQAAMARAKFGHSGVYLGSESESLVIGIPTPSFVFEYVIAQDCFPLGLVYQIVAKHGTGKSGLVAEFGRWFSLAKGGLTLCENETKFNSFWYSAIMGQRAYSRMPLHRCDSVESWQEHLTTAVRNMQTAMLGTKEDPGPGKIFPALFAVDSIMGKMSRENQEKILGKKGKKGKLGTTGQGFADPRSYPIEAGSITKYMRTFPQLIDNWPFALVMVNHLRIKKDDMGNTERNKTGGEQVNFQESFELELKKLGGPKKKIQCKQFEGVSLELSCEKNSFGATGRRAETRLIWWHEEDENGAMVQRTQWDWDWATVRLLDRLLRGENQSTYYRDRLKDIGFHLECPEQGDADNKAWSKSLGMTAKDAKSWSEVGRDIRDDEELLAKLRDALGIARRPILRGDYSEQAAALARKLP